MRKICKEKLKLERLELPREEAIRFRKNKEEPYKVELIQDSSGGCCHQFLSSGRVWSISVQVHIWIPLVVSRETLIKLTSCYGCLLRGNSDNKMLQRVYGTCFMKEG